MPLHDVSAQGIGIWQPWTPGYTGFSANPTPSNARFLVVGGICFIYYAESALGTSNATTFTITGLPVAAATTNALIPCRVSDNGVALADPGRVSFSGTVATFALTLGGGAFTASGGKGALFNAYYEIAA